MDGAGGVRAERAVRDKKVYHERLLIEEVQILGRVRQMFYEKAAIEGKEIARLRHILLDDPIVEILLNDFQVEFA